MPIHATINERMLRRTFREQVKGAVTVTGWCQLRVASSFLLSAR